MPQVTCSQCRETFQAPDDLTQAHCVRCGAAIALETGITAEVARPEIYLERSLEDAVRAPAALPEQYSNWEEMREHSLAVQRELTVLATRALPDLRRVSVRPVPEDAPDEINGWGRPLGTIEIPGESSFAYDLIARIICGCSIVAALLGIAGFIFGGPGDKVTSVHVTVWGLIGIGLTLWLIRRKPTWQATLWIFEAGVLLYRYGRKRACRWEDVLDFEASNETGRPFFCLTIEHDLTVIISHGHTPEVIPLMEYVEIRLSATQFLRRLESIWTGTRERFGVLILDRNGIHGRGLFAPWPEVRRVISDSQHLFVDWSKQPEWVPVRYADVSFPYLVMAIAHVMIEEHKRLPSEAH